MASYDNKFIGVIDSFDRFFIHYTTVSKERDELAVRIEMYATENKRFKGTIEKLQADLNDMNDMLENFHRQITQTEALKGTNRDMNEKLLAMEKDMKGKEEQYKEKLDQQRRDSEEKLAVMMETKAKDAAMERQRTLELVEERDKEISLLKQAVCTARQEKEDELAVLTMKYENKLAKIQRQNLQILQNTQQATNQDIFKKKLQHLKKSHEEEVQALRQQIKQLQELPVTTPAIVPGSRSSNWTSVFDFETR